VDSNLKILIHLLMQKECDIVKGMNKSNGKTFTEELIVL
jgi:hypothetical protein